MAKIAGRAARPASTQRHSTLPERGEKRGEVVWQGPSVETASAGLLARSLESEKDFQNAIVELAEACGWLTFHVADSRRCNPGWPDLALCHPVRHILLIIENKTERGRLRPEQKVWLDALAGVELRINGDNPDRPNDPFQVCVMRPSHWAYIEKVLKGDTQ